jgi:ABC-2 type transport system ATP-binding protein
VPATVADPLGAFVAAITGAPATTAATADVIAAEPSLIVGAPKLSLTYFGTAGAGDGPTRVFAQIVDVARGVVVGNQVTPIELVLDEASHTVEIDMETIAQSLAAGETLQLQLTPTAVEFSTPRLGGHVEFTSVDIRLPLAVSLAAG